MKTTQHAKHAEVEYGSLIVIPVDAAKLRYVPGTDVQVLAHLIILTNIHRSRNTISTLFYAKRVLATATNQRTPT
jgi:hypothetical protein